MSMPITPPQVRVPTTGPRPSCLKPAVTMSPSEPACSFATATIGPRGAFDGYVVGGPCRVVSQPWTRRASFSSTSSDTWPPLLSRTSTTSASRATSRIRSRCSWAQPLATMSGTCR